MPGPKTSVDGNRVTIGDVVYIVTPAGTNQYSVADEFGGRLGYFRLNGKAVTPDDYGLPGAAPVVQIARLWVVANIAKDDGKATPTSRGISQVAIHASATEDDLHAARLHRAWLRKQPGMRASYLLRDPASGKAMTVAIWQSQAHLDAALKVAGAEGKPLEATSVEVFPFVEEP